MSENEILKELSDPNSDLAKATKAAFKAVVAARVAAGPGPLGAALDDATLKAELDAIEYPPILWNGSYEKVMYFVHLPGGAKVKCWPNAGFMNSTDGSGRSWKPEDKVLVSVCVDDPNLRGDDYKDRCELASRQLFEGPIMIDHAATAMETQIREQPLLEIDFTKGGTSPGLHVKAGEMYAMHVGGEYYLVPPEKRIALMKEMSQLPRFAYKYPGVTRWSENKRLKRERYLKRKARR